MVKKILDKIKKKAKLNLKKIVFPEGEEIRVIKASKKLSKEKICIPILLGNKNEIKKIAKKNKINISGIEIIDPKNSEKKEKYLEIFLDKRKKKGLKLKEAKKLLNSKNNNYFGVLMVENGDADGMVSGSTCATSETLRPALQIIKTKPQIKIASSFFIMELEEKTLFFADCGFVIDPNYKELSEIAICTADSVKEFGFKPKVAMLSFSTYGSAKHELVTKVQKATKRVRKKRKEIIIDGELQLDAAIVPSISEKKCPKSVIKGKANVLIFPNLAAGNIGYKLVQRLAGAKAVGPIVQGLNKPINDLSRGCSVEDIVDVAAITAVEANKKK